MKTYIPPKFWLQGLQIVGITNAAILIALTVYLWSLGGDRLQLLALFGVGPPLLVAIITSPLIGHWYLPHVNQTLDARECNQYVGEIFLFMVINQIVACVVYLIIRFFTPIHWQINQQTVSVGFIASLIIILPESLLLGILLYYLKHRKLRKQAYKSLKQK